MNLQLRPAPANIYAYVRGNPISRVVRLGLSDIDADLDLGYLQNPFTGNPHTEAQVDLTDAAVRTGAGLTLGTLAPNFFR
jgi:hypothetical protein